jgi:hypothetical protein
MVDIKVRLDFLLLNIFDGAPAASFVRLYLAAHFSVTQAVRCVIFSGDAAIAMVVAAAVAAVCWKTI